ncbi:MAG TPA: hypothetical protein VFT78_04760, partial [Hanamia sp.]|nr:hypothetical protein [Hanamia sp.]
MWHRTLIYTFLIFLLLHAIAQTSFAQTDARNRDSIFHEYIENYKDLLTSKMSLGSKEEGFDLENTGRYKIRSNNKTKL